MLPVGVGDFLWIRFGEGNKTDHNILIDGGKSKSSCLYSMILEYIAECNQTALLVLTHIDADHIQAAAQGIADLPDGLPEKVIDKILFNTGRAIWEHKNHKANNAIRKKGEFPEDEIDVFCNSPYHSVKDAEKFLAMIERRNLKDKIEEFIIYPKEIDYFFSKLKFISPGENEVNNLLDEWEDYDVNAEIHYASGRIKSPQNIDDLKKERLGYDTSVTNRSSLAFIFEYADAKCAFLGDAVASVLCKGLKMLGITKPYPVDFVKLPHHGGKHNMSDKLLNLLPTQYYLMSTEGVPEQNIPSKVLIAHILEHRNNVTLFSNYAWWSDAYHDMYFTEADEKKYLASGLLKLIGPREQPIAIKEELLLYNCFYEEGN